MAMEESQAHSLELLKEGAWMFGWAGNRLSLEDPWISDGVTLLHSLALTVEHHETLDVSSVRGPGKGRAKDILPTTQQLADAPRYDMPTEWRLGPMSKPFGLRVGPDVEAAGELSPLACITEEIGQGGLWVDAWRLALVQLVLQVKGIALAPQVACVEAREGCWVVWFLDRRGTPVAGIVTLAANMPISLVGAGSAKVKFQTDDHALWVKAMTRLPAFIQSLSEEAG